MLAVRFASILRSQSLGSSRNFEICYRQRTSQISHDYPALCRGSFSSSVIKKEGINNEKEVQV